MTDIIVSGASSVVPGESTIDSNLTVAGYIEQSKQYLYTGTHEVRDKVQAAITSSATTIQLTYGNPAFQPGIRVSCELEDMYVWDVDGSRTLTTVERGQFGTTASSHLASSMIYASPKFSDAEILREINREIVSLSAPGAGLYQVATTDITTDGSKRGYPFPGVFANDILDIRVKTPGDSLDWPVVNNWSYQTFSETTDFATGFNLFIYDSLPTNTILHVTYSRPFTTLTNLAQVVTTQTGLASSQLDIPLLGAAINLTAGREIKRNFDEHQGETRRAAEVGPGANLSAANALRNQYRKRRVEEANRLQKQFPTRKKRVWDLGIP